MHTNSSDQFVNFAQLNFFSMHKVLLAFTLFFFYSLGNSQTFLVQEDFSGGIPSGWQVIDNDGYPLNSSMSQFTAAWISYVDGNDSVAASSSYFDDTLQASDYLILPKQDLLTFSKLSWEARSVDASYPDGYYVLLSTTDSALSSFTDTLMTVYEENFIWNRKSLLLDTMGYANQSVYIAFENMTVDGFILLLDDIWLEASDFANIPTDPELSFEIYPNPTSDILNIKTLSSISVQIIDLQGRVLLAETSNSLDVSTLQPGQYFVRITSNNGTFTKPFIKE